MSACTCYAMIGRASREGEGLRATHTIRLIEGSQPAWKLEIPALLEEGKPAREIMWIPSLEHMFEDLIVMFGIHLIKTPELLDVAAEAGVDLMGNRVTINGLPDELRKALYAAARAVDGDFKLALMIFEGSHLYRPRALSVLKEFVMDVEICRMTYKRVRTAWSDSVCEEGALV